MSVHQLNSVNQHQVSRLKRDTVLVNFVGFGNRFLFYLEEEYSGVICTWQGHVLSQAFAWRFVLVSNTSRLSPNICLSK
jgi:hypothetical protein